MEKNEIHQIFWQLKPGFLLYWHGQVAEKSFCLEESDLSVISIAQPTVAHGFFHLALDRSLWTVPRLSLQDSGTSVMFKKAQYGVYDVISYSTLWTYHWVAFDYFSWPVSEGTRQGIGSLCRTFGDVFGLRRKKGEQMGRKILQWEKSIAAKVHPLHETCLLLKVASWKVEGEGEVSESVSVFMINAACTRIISLIFMIACIKYVCCHPSWEGMKASWKMKLTRRLASSLGSEPKYTSSRAQC